jgi:hypothetical protein
MARLYAEGADTILRVALALLGLGAAGVVLVPLVWVRTPYNLERGFVVDQPVQFDHRHHVRDDEIDCLYCHGQARRSPYAGIPSTDLCMGCHSQVWNQSPMLEPLRRSYFSGAPMQWNRVNRVPDFVYFNHAIHVNKGVGCVSCHGRVDEMPLVYRHAPLTMGWCLDCHRDPARHLRPLSEITNMRWQPPNDPNDPNFGSKLATQYRVRSLTHCTTCHR